MSEAVPSFDVWRDVATKHEATLVRQATVISNLKEERDELEARVAALQGELERVAGKLDELTPVERLEERAAGDGFPCACGCGEQLVTVRLDDLRVAVRNLDVLTDAVAWVAQTNHQAHHEGPLEECALATCAHAREVTARG